MPKIVVEKGPDKGRVIHVTPGSTIVFGRETTATVQLRDTMSSRTHFQIESRDDGFYVVDLDSLNGTLLNGEPVEQARLQSGDLIKVGETLFSFMTDDQAANTLLGQRIGGYRIIERIGRGGMGTVYKAEQVDLQRIVALKVISEEHTRDKNFIDLFLHEARAAAKLNHPNIVQVYDVKRHERLYYFSMEYVSGGSVQDLLNRVRVLDPAQALKLTIEAAIGLEYAHSKDIIHRDIKPDNLMISESGSVKIGDLGLARSPKEKVGPEEQHSVIGTPHYIAPEQVLGRPADFRSDLYSLGSTLYRMVTGITPYQAATVRELVNKKVREDPQHPCEANPAISRKLADVLMRMMARDPAERYATLGECRAELESLQFSGRAGTRRARVDADPADATVPVATLLSRKKLLISSAAGILVLATAAVFGLGAILNDDKELPGETKIVEDLPERTEEQLAQDLYVNAQQLDNTAERSNLDQLRRVRDLYQDVVARCPGDKRADWAAERILTLEKELQPLEAASALAQVEKMDEEAWTSLLKGFEQGDAPDGSVVDRVALEYESVNRSFPGTAAASTAAQRALYMRAWLEAVGREASAYTALEAEIGTFITTGDFLRAWKSVARYQEEVRSRLPAGGYDPQRYSCLLYDLRASRREDDIRKASEAAYGTETEAIAVLGSKHEYEEARYRLHELRDRLLPAESERANQLLLTVTKEEKIFRETVEKERLETRQKDLAADTGLFDSQAVQIYTTHIRHYDFAAAIAKMQQLEFRTPDFQARQRTRLDEFIRAAQFMTTLVDLLQKKSTKLNRRFKGPGMSAEGEIVSADKDGVAVTSRGGELRFRFDQLSPAAFHEWVTRAWRFQDSDAADRGGLAILCVELGLYEEANTHFEALSKSVKVQQDPALREFCGRYINLILTREYTESLEVEAMKTMVRAEQFMAVALKADPKEKDTKLAAADAEVQLLETRYAATRSVQENQDRIRQWVKDLENYRSRHDDDRKQGQKLQRLRDEVKKRKDRIIGRQEEIRKLLTRIPLEVIEAMHMAELHLAYEDRVNSTRQLDWVREKLEDEKARSHTERDRRRLNVLLGRVYTGLMRNNILRSDEDGLGKNQHRAKLQGLDVWESVDAWHKVYKTVDLEALRRKVEEGPDNPEALHALAQGLLIRQESLPEARALVEWLMEEYAEYVKGRDGDVELLKGQILYQFRDVTACSELIESIRETNPALLEGDKLHDLRSRMRQLMDALRGVYEEAPPGDEEEPQDEKKDEPIPPGPKGGSKDGPKGSGGPNKGPGRK